MWGLSKVLMNSSIRSNLVTCSFVLDPQKVIEHQPLSLMVGYQPKFLSDGLVLVRMDSINF